MPDIAQCDDIVELREIYRACQVTTPASIREWSKAVEQLKRKAEKTKEDGDGQ